MVLDDLDLYSEAGLPANRNDKWDAYIGYRMGL